MMLEATEVKRQEVYRVADELFKGNADWVKFFREVLGVEGAMRRQFPTAEELAAFEKTEEYVEIQRMMTQLRSRHGRDGEGSEPTRVITVRLPKSMHESLMVEAHSHQTSMNKLCISKLLRMGGGEPSTADQPVGKATTSAR